MVAQFINLVLSQLKADDAFDPSAINHR